jgi:AcrR family transcriptional regulator
MTGTALREPRQDRGRATRLRLLESAVGCLSELGWNGATVSVIAARAGVSRGATQHYFPTREDLFTAAIDHMAQVRLAEIRRQAARLPADGPRRTRDVVGLLVGLYTGPLFRAALQVWAAASASGFLRELVLPLEAKLGRVAHRAAIELLGADESRPGVHEAVQATLDLARGLGLADTLADDSRRRDRIIAQWAVMLDAAVAVPGCHDRGKQDPRERNGRPDPRRGPSGGAPDA